MTAKAWERDRIEVAWRNPTSGQPLRCCPRSSPCLSCEVRDPVVERRVLRLRLRLLRHAHADAVDKLAPKRGLLTAQHDHVADPVVRVVADASAQDVEVCCVDDEALLLALEAQNGL